MENKNTSSIIVRAGRMALKSSTFSTAIIVTILLSGMLIAKPNYLSGPNIEALTRVMTITALIGLSQMIIIACNGLNLSVGSTGALSAIIAGWAMSRGGFSWPVAVLLGLATGLVCGLINGLLIYRAGGVGVAFFLTTLATSSIFKGINLIITSGNPYYGPNGKFDPAFLAIGNTKIFGLPSSCVIMLVIAALLMYMYRSLSIGRQMLSFGANYKAAELYGVSRFRVVFASSMIAAVIASVAGLLAMIRIEAAQPNMGADWMLMSFAAPLIGGTRNNGGKINVPGTILGALSLTIITNGLVHLQVNVYWNTLIYGIILLAAVTIDRLRYIRK